MWDLIYFCIMGHWLNVNLINRGFSVRLRHHFIPGSITTILFFCCILVFPTHAAEPSNEVNSAVEALFGGRWRTQSGSVYQFVDGAMVCLFVHDEQFKAWQYKKALQNFKLKKDGWYADQAFRDLKNGWLNKIKPAKITIIDESSFKTQVITQTGEADRCCQPQLWVKIP